ncbi:MAG: dephospho-CoA kinase [Tunicatimonas sp.]
MAPEPRRVGITGGIGSGKTFVSKIFEFLGIPVYYADARAKWLQENDLVLVQQIQQVFGPQAYDATGRLNRTFLANEIFSSDAKRKIINDVVHPRVAEDYQHWVQQRGHLPYTLKEAALLFETNAHRKLTLIINVNAPEAIRIGRVLQRDPQRSPQQVKQIIAQQLDDTERSRRADYSIDNSGENLVLPQVLTLHHHLVNY